jgi:hypothetical protein
MRMIEWVEVCKMPNRTASLIYRVRLFISGRIVYLETMLLKLVERTLEIWGKTLPYQHPDTLSSMYDVARAHYDLGNYDDAEGRADQLYPLDVPSCVDAQPLRRQQWGSTTSVVCERRSAAASAKSIFHLVYAAYS